ncbi:hypothetical protein M6B38_154065 [Iris pallida]|uniref:Uncharacterized protein n=1 Tax=Iris pallida TaxID=29817 RepID=A0AAX6F5C3_IRIPA|nr:hypothetical protein M6B38_154065 [Iris pallida]
MTFFFSSTTPYLAGRSFQSSSPSIQESSELAMVRRLHLNGVCSSVSLGDLAVLCPNLERKGQCRTGKSSGVRDQLDVRVQCIYFQCGFMSSYCVSSYVGFESLFVPACSCSAWVRIQSVECRTGTKWGNTNVQLSCVC